MFAALIALKDPSLRERFGSLLRASDFEIHEASPRADLFERVRETQPDVVLLDSPALDSENPASHRSLSCWKDSAGPPILILLSGDDPSEIRSALADGADDYLQKDAPEEAILARFQRLARSHRLARLATLNEGLVQIGRLLTGIVHEIRGPIAVIRGNAEILRMEFPDLPGLDVRLEPLIQNCQLLQVRLEQLMATVQGGSGTQEALNLTELLQEVTKLFRMSVRSRTPLVTILTDYQADLPPVVGDIGRIMQVLLNLLGNAYEAIVSDKDSGQIQVTARLEQEDGRDWVRVDVIDDGPGLPEAHLGRLFEPFFTTKPHGSGIGLYLADTFIHEQGGRIRAQNRPEGGACLSIWLPSEPLAEPDAN